MKHIGNITQGQRGGAHFCDKISDLNPLDYNIWGFVESRACATPHPSVKALQQAVDKAWEELLTVDHVKKTCAAFPDRLRKMIAAKGKTFEPRKKK